MPSTLVSIRKPRPPAERRAIIDAVHAALVESIGIPAHDRSVRLQAFEPDDFAVAAQASENFTLVEVSLFPGRSLAAKRSLYQALVRCLGDFGVAPADVRVILYEVPREDWGLRGGIPGSELDAGFKVEV
ncbi:MAG: tautomerase family protein [Nevskia sp.]|nr:tautomerase family protein [Nevskia sp.]